ncbi:transmission trait enhancer LetE [Legionella sp. W05-934-2]|uniref:transmission trait enhancer LetE n=1 Tax=Legionella sp. W05-934-2 TaxID=1198649 RepID=UPI003461FD99
MKDTNAIIPDLKLRFNIEHPTIEESYHFGYECALAELDLEENPFKEGTQPYEQWQEGWWAGFYGEKPLFELTEYPEEVKRKDTDAAANDADYYQEGYTTVRLWLKITGALAASAIIGYQVLDMVA